MADRWFKQFVRTPDTNVVMLDGYVNCNGSTSAVSTYTLPFATPVRTSTGKYTITLADSYPSLLSCTVTPVLKTGIADIQWSVTSADVTTAKTIVIQFATGTAAADLGTGDGFFVSLKLKNSGLGKGQ